MKNGLAIIAVLPIKASKTLLRLDDEVGKNLLLCLAGVIIGLLAINTVIGLYRSLPAWVIAVVILLAFWLVWASLIYALGLAEHD